MQYLIDFANWFLDGLAIDITWALSLLPKSPTADWVNNKPDTINLGYITWFIPFPTMLLHLAGLLVAIGLYYLIRIVMRWLKVVRG